MSTLDFLYALANNPTQALKFRRDPSGVARAAGLSDEAAALLATRDSAKLRQRLSIKNEAAAIYTTETAMIYTSEAA